MKRPAANGGYPGSVTQVSHGYRMLVDDVTSAGTATTFATFIASLNPTVFICAIGSNDATLPGGPTLANFTASYGYLLDALHAAMPALKIHCVSPIIRGADPEPANAEGKVMDDFRAAISTLVSARSGWSPAPTYTNGKPIIPLASLPDQTHPGTQGNADYMFPAFMTVAAGPPWVPLFANGEKGAWLAPDNAATLFRDTAGTLPAALNGNVKRVNDMSGGGHHATRTAPTSTIRYVQDDEFSKPFVNMALDGRDDLTIDFGTALGSACTIVFGNAHSVEFREAQTVGATYAITKSFWQFMIVNRALTPAEKTDIRTYFASKSPAANSTWDFYASPTGNNANDGLTATTPKTFDGGVAQLFAGATGKKLAFLPGTYNEAAPTGDAALTSNSVPGLTGKQQYLCFPFGPVIFDGGVVAGTVDQSGIASDQAGYTMTILGDGNLTVRNYGNDGFSCGSGVINVYDAHVHAVEDGVSCHVDGVGRYRRVTAWNNSKSAFSHVTNASTLHVHCIFRGKEGSGNGIGYAGDGNTNYDFLGCDFLPDPLAATTGKWLVSSGSSNNATTTVRKFRHCRFGAPHLTPDAATTPTWSFFKTNFEDCYFGGMFLLPGIGTAHTVTYTRCFGKFTGVAWGALDVVQTYDHCVWAGPGIAANQQADKGFVADVYSAPTLVFGTGTVKNCILSSVGVAFYVQSNAAEFNAQWSLPNNAFHNISFAAYYGGATSDGGDVTANPLLKNPTTDEQRDYKVNAGSPTLGAGVGGVDIGLGS
jgi:hypothetical protein